MALHIQFIKNGESTPTPLNTIDEELCTLLNEPINPSKYIHCWLDMIGQQVCIKGYELGTQTLREKVLTWDMPELVIIHDYLVENFTVRTWSK